MQHYLINSMFIGLMTLPSIGAPINITGTVTNKANGQKLAGAVVELAIAKISDTTSADGLFSFTQATSISPFLKGKNSAFKMALAGNHLVFSTSKESDLRISLHDLNGQEVAEIFSGHVSSGRHEVALSNVRSLSGIQTVKAEANYGIAYFRIVSTAAGLAMSPILAQPGLISGQAKKSAAAVDTLKVKKSGFADLALPIDTYSGTFDLALESQGVGVGCAGATVCWTFEDGKLPPGSRAAILPGPGQYARGPLPLVDKLQAHGGVYAMHLNNLTGQPMRDIELDLPANFGPVLWGRVFLYITPNAPMPVAGQTSSHGAFFKGLYSSPDATGLYWYETGFEMGKYVQIQHIPEPPGFPEWVLYNEKVVTGSKWECVEWEMDAVLPSEPKLFVDGVQVVVTERKGWDNDFFTVKPENLYKKADHFKKFWLGLDMYHPIKDKTELWFDDFAVGPKRIGCN